MQRRTLLEKKLGYVEKKVDPETLHPKPVQLSSSSASPLPLLDAPPCHYSPLLVAPPPSLLVVPPPSLLVAPPPPLLVAPPPPLLVAPPPPLLVGAPPSSVVFSTTARVLHHCSPPLLRLHHHSFTHFSPRLHYPCCRATTAHRPPPFAYPSFQPPSFRAPSLKALGFSEFDSDTASIGTGSIVTSPPLSLLPTNLEHLLGLTHLDEILREADGIILCSDAIVLGADTLRGLYLVETISTVGKICAEVELSIQADLSLQAELSLCDEFFPYADRFLETELSL
ncbi:extensin-1-like [Vigna umbellata]|uniref:extensin-1-like n=1 Tax=Vigna umbellata TaxID=87088 RepID=UPI001F5EC737|nr:extensin-1-like [Vigna umbellata]